MTSSTVQAKSWRSRLTIFVGPAALILVWWVVAHLGLIRPIFLPAPWAVCKAMIRLIMGDDGGLTFAVLSTLGRVFLGLFLGVAIGIPIGLILSHFRWVYALCEVPVDFFRSVPVTALFPFFLIVLGVGDKSKVLIVAWAIALIMIINTVYGVRNCSKTRRKYLESIGAGPIYTMLFHTLPEAIPSIVGGLRISISQAFIVVVVTEMIFSADRGIGYLLYSAALLYRTDEVVALILVVGILGYLVNKIAERLGKRLVFWEQ